MVYTKETLKVMIDPGHKRHDDRIPGSRPGDENINLAIAFYLRYELEKVGINNIELTRHSNIYIPLARRVELTGLYNADMYISISCDTSYREKENGHTVWIGTAVTGDTFVFADSISKYFARDYPNHKRFGVRHARYQVVEQPRVAVQIECKAIRKPEDQVKFAQGIKDAVIRCIKR